jgi:signal transduction histidine kinase
MQNELLRIETILDELLLLAKPQVLKMKPASIQLLVEDVITLLSTQAILHNVDILSDFDDAIPPVVCEGNQLKQVFVNVIKNAIEAMPQGGHLYITGQMSDDHVLIQFTDQGVGIPPDQLPNLGEPFYTTKESGNGLGLMVSQKIILAHQGTMDVKSQLEKGTTVRIHLPISIGN